MAASMTLTVEAKEMPQDYALRASGRAFKNEEKPREERVFASIVG